MKIIKSIFFLMIIMIFCSAKADIYNAASIEEINNTILELLEKRNPKKTLFIAPLQGFIIEPADEEFRINDKKHLSVMKRVLKKARLSRRAYLNELILTEYRLQFIDPFIIKFIKNIQEKNVPLLIFTDNFSGSFNEIPYLEVWTWSFLFNNDIDLSKSPIGSKQFIFNQYYEKVKGSYPTYYKGFLSSNSWEGKNSIQSILAALFSMKFKFLPDVIYVVHQDESFIKSIEQQFKSLRQDIQIEGFVFDLKKKQEIDLPKKQIEKFWTELITKLNKVTRKERSADEEDPYEQ